MPAPLDLVKEKRGDKISILTPKKLNFDYKTDLSIEYLPFASKEINYPEQATGFISIEELKIYLLGKNALNLKQKSEFVELEPRIGIEIDKSKKTTKEGKLYSVKFLRFKKNCGFAVFLDDLNFGNEKGIYFIGGEKRQVFYERKNDINILETNFLNETKKKIQDTKRFKILLITPSYNDISKNNIEPQEIKELLKGINPKFISACIKTEYSGGFDIEKNHPKAIEKLISEGSVFYYELTDISKTDELFKLNFSSISSKHKELGYGKILIGGW